MSTNLYAKSWRLYKKESESFLQDLNYYTDFCRGKTCLEMFSGYGRLANHIKDISLSLDCVELEGNFTQFINLPKENIFIQDILKFKPKRKYERIYAGYNSFCLLTNDSDIHKFFKNLSEWISDDGKISLSYYDYNFWEETPGSNFKIDGKDCAYKPSYKKVNSSSIAIWIDNFYLNETIVKFEYPVRVYNDPSEVVRFLGQHQLELVDVILDYNETSLKGSGWVEYVIKKSN